MCGAFSAQTCGQNKLSSTWTIKACRRCKGTESVVWYKMFCSGDFLTCENKTTENKVSLQCFCRRVTCLRAHWVLGLQQSWFLSTAACLLESEMWNIQSFFRSRSVKAQLTGPDLYLNMWTSDINKDGWRVPTSSHCTKVKSKYPGY